jgi:hypothetical protein
VRLPAVAKEMIRRNEYWFKWHIGDLLVNDVLVADLVV